MSQETRHKQTNITGIVAWRTEAEVGVDCNGLTWTGSIEAFEREWE